MTDDKFIMMGIDDENSKEIAEILKSTIAKKIIDYLSEVQEASETDLAEKLHIPLNTIEYNLKKLIRVGFVVKTNNFFWSVKGKKIPMYKLVKKHIIIGAKKPTLQSIRTILPFLLVALGIIAVIVLFSVIHSEKYSLTESDDLKQFETLDELKTFLKEHSGENYGPYNDVMRTGVATAPALAKEDGTPESSLGAAGVDYSQTNIQVAGVDEADIVKSDGTYFYIVGNNNVRIVDAIPATEMNTVSTIKGDEGSYISQLYIHNNKLIVFSNKYSYFSRCKGEVCIAVTEELPARFGILPPDYSKQSVIVSVYDVSQKDTPVLEHEVDLEGNYIDSRLIGDYVYLISNDQINLDSPQPPIYYLDKEQQMTSLNDVYYFNYPDSNYVFTSISSINVENGAFDHTTYVTGYSSTLYVSENNLYMTYPKTKNHDSYTQSFAESVVIPLLPDQEYRIQEIISGEENSYEQLQLLSQLLYDHSLSLQGEEKEQFDSRFKELMKEFERAMSKEYEKTIIHRFSIDSGEVMHEAVGEVSGHVLNQFSLDEYNNYLRVTTTTGNSWSDTSLNHLFILDSALKQVGSVEDLASGEQIYSTRFMGEKVYLVTFRQVDPLYVIDVHNPEKPEVLGYLKVTGYSSYLHPYDENHIIGVGNEASEEGRVKGLKIALFDVSDFAHPQEISTFDFSKDSRPGWQSSSNSNALYDHKAFLFTKEKSLLVIPVSTYSYPTDYRLSESWEGVYVFGINPIEGISLRGKITHDVPYASIQRSAYIENILYTFSQYRLQAHDLSTLSLIKSLELELAPQEGEPNPTPLTTDGKVF